MDSPAQKTNTVAGLSGPSLLPQRISLSGTVLFQAVVLFVFLTFLYGPVVVKLVRQWMSDPNYSHGFLVPAGAGFLLWVSRKAWMEEPLEPTTGGLVFIVIAMGLLVVGTLGAELFLPRVSLCILIGGLVVYFAGWRMLHAVLAPWLVLFLMIPLPTIVFNQLAFPLQILASRLACGLLELLQVPVLREGNVIVLPKMTLDVVEACSGLRSLMSLITIAVFYGLFFERRAWMRWLLVIVAVPVAVFTNALRIMIAAVLAQYVNPDLAEGFFHAFSGLLLFVLSLVALAGVQILGNQLARKRMAT